MLEHRLLRERWHSDRNGVGQRVVSFRYKWDQLEGCRGGTFEAQSFLVFLMF